MGLYDCIDALKRHIPLIAAGTVVLAAADALTTYFSSADGFESPETLRLAFAAAGGLLAGVLAALLLTVLEYSRLSVTMLDKMPELFHIGSVPAVKKLITYKRQPVFPCSIPAYEALMAVRTNLMYLLERESVNTIMVTSPREAEGKTTLAINIAVCFSQFYRKVLLVDCNFKNPAASRLIRPAGETPEPAAAQEYANEFVASPVKDLGIDVVLNGMIPREQPTVDYTLLASMIETLKDRYDLIILDCPPILNNADTRMLSYIAKNAVIVADYRRLSRRLIENSIHRLTQIDVKILGVILNRVPKQKIL